MATKNRSADSLGGTVWAFDLGKGSIGEAVRQGNKFLHKASLLIPAELAEKKTGLRKPRVEVIVPALRRKRLGSSQPIVAARLVLIRDFCNAYHNRSQHHE